MGKLRTPDSALDMAPDTTPGVPDEAAEPPNYLALASQLADLGRQAARQARQTGNGDLGVLALRLGHCAASMLRDLNRTG